MNRKQTIDFFARSLQAFESSHDAFRVLGTVTTAQQTAAATFTAATTATTTTTGSTSKTTATAGDDGITGAHALKAKKLIVLDSSFNPPTRAHAQMASSALRDAGNDDDDNTRLLLLLAVNNADKQAAPAAYPTRLGMMAAFARDLRSTHDVDLGVTTMPFFHDKARSIVESGTYYHHHRRHHHPACAANSADGGEERRRLRLLPPEQVFLCGFDTVVRIFDPKYYGASPSAMRAALGPFFAPVSDGGGGGGGGSELGARLRVTTRPDDAWGAVEEQRAYLQRLGEGGGLAQMGGDAAWVKRIEMVSGLGGAAVSSSRVREVVKRRRYGSDAELGDLVSDGVRAYIEEEGLYQDHLP
ncbi:cytidylyltransferase [Moelleriella libera RCEF 2490]|uniref:Cytidylyltransferase n=1 Tax=Moelleriella libera RCEF 2490 TaxID=1081109 RepID=A0A162ITV1_9HYPO|nr:cytidylyltransferase [Moelleriella libera RCEF 2490]